MHEHNWQDKVPPLVSDERKDRQRTAMPISLSYTSFTLNSTHFSLFKKERGCERPAGASEASTGSELVSFFLKKREMSGEEVDAKAREEFARRVVLSSYVGCAAELNEPTSSKS